MRSTPIHDNDSPSWLSISELAARTRMPAATLRTWEARHGFPSPTRGPGGHRRYREQDVVLVEEILRQRDSGHSLTGAIAQAKSHTVGHDPSVFAGLRRRHPELVAHVLKKATLLAMTRAIEDECCARAERPVLFVSFQRQYFYDQSRPRWTELARTAESVIVFADFTRPSAPGKWPQTIPVPADAPLRREWVIVCDAPDYPACVTGWEHPGQGEVPDSARRFEAVWSVDARVVRGAAHICAQLARTFAPDHAPTSAVPLPEVTPPAASADLRRAAGLLDRMLGYVDDAYRA